MLHTKHAWRDLQDHSHPGPAANLVGVVCLLETFDVCGGPIFLKAFSLVEASPSAAVNVWTRSGYKPHLVQHKSKAVEILFPLSLFYCYVF